MRVVTSRCAGLMAIVTGLIGKHDRSSAVALCGVGSRAVSLTNSDNILTTLVQVFSYCIFFVGRNSAP
jgi:hypothetical protein